MATVRKRSWATKGGLGAGWVVDYRDNDGKRRQTTFRLKRDADRYLATLLGELADGAHVPSRDSITVREACDLWLERAIREKLEPSTYEGYEQVTRLHVIPLIGNVKLSAITTVRLEIFRDKLLEMKTFPTARRALGYLKMVLHEARRLGKMSKNVGEDVVIKEKGREKEDVVILSTDELNDFLDAAEDLGPREAAFAHLAMHGLRSSEIRGFPWKNYNNAKATVHIGQRADKRCKIGPPKSKKSRRTITLTPAANSALRAWQKQSDSADLAFPHNSGRPMFYAEFVSDIFDPIMFAGKLTTEREIGGETHRYSLHKFRHTTASIWIEQGFSAKRVSQLLGHSSIQVTFDLYGHLIDLQDSSDEMMRKLERAFRRPRSDESHGDS